MPVPWLQIVQLVPSILDVSRELMKRTKQTPPAPALASHSYEDLAARIASLEENERRQAELVAQMAEQPLPTFTSACCGSLPPPRSQSSSQPPL